LKTWDIGSVGDASYLTTKPISGNLHGYFVGIASDDMMPAGPKRYIFYRIHDRENTDVCCVVATNEPFIKTDFKNEREFRIAKGNKDTLNHILSTADPVVHEITPSEVTSIVERMHRMELKTQIRSNLNESLLKGTFITL